VPAQIAVEAGVQMPSEDLIQAAREDLAGRIAAEEAEAEAEAPPLAQLAGGQPVHAPGGGADGSSGSSGSSSGSQPSLPQQQAKPWGAALARPRRRSAAQRAQRRAL
jgi:hypothetical protein